MLRQTPGRKGIWDDCQFHYNSKIKRCDAWFVFDELHHEDSVICPPENTYLITAEPPVTKQYLPVFLNQFSSIITVNSTLNHPHLQVSCQLTPWWVGRKLRNDLSGWEPNSLSYDDFSSMGLVPKHKLISFISSDKQRVSGHKLRYGFIEQLRCAFGDKIDIFGFGINRVIDKWDAIAPYKYHITVENCQHPHYWSEKLGDVFLADSYPLYFGCPNVVDYYDSNSLTTIDINNPKKAINTIKWVINHHLFEKSLAARAKSKDLVLNRYNIFAMMANIAKAQIKRQSHTQRPRLVILTPEHQLLHQRWGLKRDLRHIGKKILHRFNANH